MNSLFTVALLFKAIDAVTAPVRKINDALGSTGKEADKAANKMDALLKKTEKLGKAAEKLEGLGKPLAAAGAAGSLAIGGAIVSFANLEEAQKSLRTTLMDQAGKVGPEFEKLNALAEKLGTDLPGSTKDMIEMFIALRNQGVQTQNILGGMGEATAKFSTLMKIPFAEGATHVAKFSESMGVAEKDSVHFMNLLQRLKYASGVEVGELAYTFKYAGGSLKLLGLQGLDAARDFGTIVGVLAAAGIEGSTAGTNMAQALSRMAEIGHRLDRGQVKKLVGPVLDKYNIKLDFFTAQGEFKGLRPMVEQLEKLKALNPQEQIIVLKKLFGDEAARPLAVLLKSGIKGYDEMLQRMAKQADMEKKINEIMSGTKMQWETMTGTVSNLTSHIGGVFSKLTNMPGILSKLNDLFGKLDSWVLLHPKTAGIIAGVTLTIVGLSVTLGGLLMTVGLIGVALPKALAGLIVLGKGFVWLSGMMRTLLIATRVLSVALLTTPIGWVIMGITAIAVSAYLIYKYWTPIKAFFKGLWTGIFGFLQTMPAKMLQAGKNIINSIYQGMMSMINKPVELLKSLAQKLRNLLPFSPAKDGPLKDIHKIRLIETIAETVRPAPLMKAMKAATAAAMIAVTPVMSAAAGAPVSSTASFRQAATTATTIHFSPQITIQGGNAEQIKGQVQQAMSVSFAEFERLMQRYEAQKSRRSFS